MKRPVRYPPSLSSRSRWSGIVLLLLFGAWIGLAAGEQQDAPQPRTLVGQLRLMAAQQGFEISGLGQVDSTAPAVEPEPEADTTTRRIRSLLRGYDHVVVHASKEHIERLLILGKKRAAPPTPPPPEENILPTRRQGDHHLVTATLRGKGSEAVEMELMVDTGASLVVLPTSAAAKLGLEPAKLEGRELQTAQGKLQARIGHIGSIELGSARLEDIEAAFVEDELLGENALLGMNVLGRYLFILDDDNNLLTLIPEAR